MKVKIRVEWKKKSGFESAMDGGRRVGGRHLNGSGMGTRVRRKGDRAPSDRRGTGL